MLVYKLSQNRDKHIVKNTHISYMRNDQTVSLSIGMYLLHCYIYWFQRLQCIINKSDKEVNI